MVLDLEGRIRLATDLACRDVRQASAQRRSMMRKVGFQKRWLPSKAKRIAHMRRDLSQILAGAEKNTG